VNLDVVNAHFPSTQFRYGKKVVMDVINKNEPLVIITAEHNRELNRIRKFSKLAVVQPGSPVTWPSLQLVNLFPQIRTIYFETIFSLLKNSYRIDIVNAAPLYSWSNGSTAPWQKSPGDGWRKHSKL